MKLTALNPHPDAGLHTSYVYDNSPTIGVSTNDIYISLQVSGTTTSTGAFSPATIYPSIKNNRSSTLLFYWSAYYTESGIPEMVESSFGTDFSGSWTETGSGTISANGTWTPDVGILQLVASSCHNCPYTLNTTIHFSTVSGGSPYTPTASPTITPTATNTPTFTPSPTITPTPTDPSWHLGNFRPDAYGVKANISAPSDGLSLQSSGESNWVSLPTPYWVQAGWRYYKDWIWAWSYVESYSPTTGYAIQDYSIHNWGNVIEYKVEWTSGTTWCGWIDGENKACYDTQPAPITVSARSEVHASSQNELNTYFWLVSYLDSSGYWTPFDQALWQEGPPYTIDKTQYYDFHNYGP